MKKILKRVFSVLLSASLTVSLAPEIALAYNGTEIPAVSGQNVEIPQQPETETNEIWEDAEQNGEEPEEVFQEAVPQEIFLGGGRAVGKTGTAGGFIVRHMRGGQDVGAG